jgi:hypothetical protein
MAARAEQPGRASKESTYLKDACVYIHVQDRKALLEAAEKQTKLQT